MADKGSAADDAVSECSTCSSHGALSAVGAKVAARGSRKLAWQLIWCHERCHKGERVELRDGLAAAVLAWGGSLACVKKANQFIDSVMGKERCTPYVLLTDWREVKQSIEAVTLSPYHDRPVFTVVLCEEQRQYDRASRWVAGLPGRPDPIYVCRDLKAPKAFVRDLLAQMKQLLSDVKLLGPTSRKQQELLGLTSPQARRHAPATLHGTTCSSFKKLESKAEQWSLQVTTLPWPVIQVIMQAWGPYHSPAEVELMLQRAAPDHYED